MRVVGTARSRIDFILGSRHLRTLFLYHYRPDIDCVSDHVAEAATFDLGVAAPARGHRCLPNSWSPKSPQEFTKQVEVLMHAGASVPELGYRFQHVTT